MARRRSVSRRAIVAGVAAVAVVGAGTSAWALSGGKTASYRTAAVSHGSVRQTLTTTGAISPMREADLDFQVAGTIGHVAVRQGQRVKAGERVASLDRTTLRAEVHAAESTLNQARESLASDESSQASDADANSGSRTPTNSSSPSPTVTKTPTATPSSPATSPISAAQLAKIQRDQAAVVAAQHQADTDLATAKTALIAETTACASELAGSTTATDAASCVTATKASLADQQTVQRDQQAVAKAETTLASDLGNAASSATGSGGRTPTKSSDTNDSSQQSSGSVLSAVDTLDSVKQAKAAAVTPAAASPVGDAGDDDSGTSITAATLAGDQATIDADRASLVTARADLRQATLTSPIAGKVVAVTIGKGDSVSGSSTAGNPSIEVVASHLNQVTVDLSAAQVREIKTGMHATVIPDGASKPISGTVSSIGSGSTDSTTGDTTYPVVIALSATAGHLVAGADAAVTVTLATITDATTVPTSAVHRSGSTTYVEALVGGKLTRRTVTVGAVGAAVTQIRSGLSVGQRVVLANLNAAVPSSSTNLINNGPQFSGGGTFTRGPVPFKSSGGGVPNLVINR